MQARPSPRRPLVSWIDDGGSMPVRDGRMRGIRSIRERDFLLGKVRSWPESTVCSHQSAGLPSPSNRRTKRVSMLSINRSQTPRTGTVMTAQIEAVDFFAFDNSYARLPDRFFARLRPTPVAAPRLEQICSISRIACVPKIILGLTSSEITRDRFDSAAQAGNCPLRHLTQIGLELAKRHL